MANTRTCHNYTHSIKPCLERWQAPPSRNQDAKGSSPAREIYKLQVPQQGEVMAQAVQRPCPCCGDDMDACNVVCWPCYRATDRLTPGTHLDPNRNRRTKTFQPTIIITQAQIDAWDNERETRLAKCPYCGDERHGLGYGCRN